MSKQELKNYVINSIVHNDFDPNELLRLINLLPDKPQLNDNQQIVLDWLKENYNHKYSKGREVFWALSMFTTNSMYEDFAREPIGKSYSKLNNQQFAQVLEAFAKWAQEQEGETE